jgi:hypothetical protein
MDSAPQLQVMPGPPQPWFGQHGAPVAHVVLLPGSHGGPESAPIDPVQT